MALKARAYFKRNGLVERESTKREYYFSNEKVFLATVG